MGKSVASAGEERSTPAAPMRPLPVPEAPAAALPVAPSSNSEPPPKMAQTMVDPGFMSYVEVPSAPMDRSYVEVAAPDADFEIVPPAKWHERPFL